MPALRVVRVTLRLWTSGFNDQLALVEDKPVTSPLCPYDWFCWLL